MNAPFTGPLRKSLICSPAKVLEVLIFPWKFAFGPRSWRGLHPSGLGLVDAYADPLGFLAQSLD